MAKLRDEGCTLSLHELKELSTRIKALEDMARLEDRFKALEDRKRQRPSKIKDDQPEPKHFTNPCSLSHYSIVRPSIELDDSKSSSNTI